MVKISFKLKFIQNRNEIQAFSFLKGRKPQSCINKRLKMNIYLIKEFLK